MRRLGKARTAGSYEDAVVALLEAVRNLHSLVRCRVVRPLWYNLVHSCGFEVRVGSYSLRRVWDHRLSHWYSRVGTLALVLSRWYSRVGTLSRWYSLALVVPETPQIHVSLNLFLYTLLVNTHARSPQVSVSASVPSSVEESTPLAPVQGSQTPIVWKGAHEPTRCRDATLPETSHLQGFAPVRCTRTYEH